MRLRVFTYVRARRRLRRLVGAALTIFGMLIFTGVLGHAEENPIPCPQCCERNFRKCQAGCALWNIFCACGDILRGCLTTCAHQGQPLVRCAE